MRRQNPDHKMDIPISMAVHWQLVGASIRTGFAKEDWEIAAEAIDEWVRRHDPDGVPMAPTRGYQWKSVFLPEGTTLRTVFGGKNHHCQVENDRILYNGQAVSPSGFINAVGGVRRNAWRSIWLLRPEDKHWVLADCVRAPRCHSARKPKPTSQPTASPTPQQAHIPATTGKTSLETITTTPAQPGRQQHIGATPSPRRRTGDSERRMHADHRQSSTLRDELMLLLARTQALQPERHATRAWPDDPPR